MNKLFVTGFLSGALLAPMVAHASTAELRLTGTITPSACMPSFTGGTTIDYGNIPADSLNWKSQTTLPLKQTSLNVTCDAPTVFYLSTTDERAGTLVEDVQTEAANHVAMHKFGLGSTDSGVNIGAYSLRVANETSDSGATNELISVDSGTTWVDHVGALRSDGSGLIGFGDSASATVPSAHTSVDMDIVVFAAIDKAANLPLQDEIKLDGLAMIEVVYP